MLCQCVRLSSTIVGVKKATLATGMAPQFSPSAIYLDNKFLPPQKLFIICLLENCIFAGPGCGPICYGKSQNITKERSDVLLGWKCSRWNILKRARYILYTLSTSHWGIKTNCLLRHKDNWYYIFVATQQVVRKCFEFCYTSGFKISTVRIKVICVLTF